MDINFKTLSYKERSVGKIIKSSKIEYIWQFEIKSKMCFFVLKASKFSGNYTVLLNKKILYRGNLFLNSNYILFTLKIEGIEFSITKINYQYELLIEKIPFMDYYQNKKIRKNIVLTPKVIKIKNKNCFKDSKLKKSHSTNYFKKENKIRQSSLFKLKKENQKEFLNSEKIKKEILESNKNLNKNKLILNKKDLNQKIENFKRIRFTKDFKEFEEVEIFLYPIDFPRQTQKIQKIVKIIHKHHFD